MLANRVKETTASTGNGDLTLAGAEANFQSFHNAFSTTGTFYYFIIDDVNNEWESGIGQLSSATNFQRQTVHDNSSGSTAKLNLSAGAKTIICAQSEYSTQSAVNVSAANAALTAADLVLTNADVASIQADKAQTALDRVATGNDKTATNADVVLTNADVVLAEADKVQTGLDRAAVAADLILTNQDTIDTAADVQLAEGHKNTATTQASTATTQASTATTQAGIATTQAGIATTQAGIATDKAVIATDKATEAANSASSITGAETASANSASTATTKASEASSSASAAANSAAAAASSFDNFDDKYLGSKSSEPSVDNDGNALVTGALYFLVGTGMQVYDGTDWIAASSSGTSSLFTYEYIATAGQTSFSGADANGQTLAYSANNIHVTYGGLDIPVADYVATNGTAVVLDDGAVVGTIVRITAFKSFTIADTYTKAQTDARVMQGEVFYENPTTVTTDYTITTNKNAMSAGPITINSGVTITVPNGSTWTVV